MTDLYRLVYASKNLLRGTEAEMTAEVRQILDASQRNNQAVGVTGALMFNAGAFAQVLEGPRAGVEATFERIQRDLRHSDVTVLQCGLAESRGFANWSMAFVGQSALGQTRFSGLAAESGFDLSRLDGDRVFSMLHGLVVEEEGIPAAEIAPPVEVTRTVAALDVVQVRAEIAQLRPDTAAPAPAPAPAAAIPSRAAAPRDATEAALHVLKAALASERARTTELRAEIDALRIALASAEDRIGAVHEARDLWAGRARLLAQAMVQEADGLDAAPIWELEADQPATLESVAA
ncbi:BLUF domain-containing protein [Methylobacterium sp. E-005]|uniref:BLUF domain-containing protein n=1 Tax=Methylobacterium sp. E-005 TaxID=2836549 RepID=UPI001FB9A733|nr:BLUF domain-containing protein [Methylobacterium sp. E-005]MCJ2088935.1 BLUF domain-containing protein [Methylobacterium sp. E-005]